MFPLEQAGIIKLSDFIVERGRTAQFVNDGCCNKCDVTASKNLARHLAKRN